MRLRGRGECAQNPLGDARPRPRLRQLYASCLLLTVLVGRAGGQVSVEVRHLSTAAAALLLWPRIIRTTAGAHRRPSLLLSGVRRARRVGRAAR